MVRNTESAFHDVAPQNLYPIYIDRPRGQITAFTHPPLADTAMSSVVATTQSLGNTYGLIELKNLSAGNYFVFLYNPGLPAHMGGHTGRSEGTLLVNGNAFSARFERFVVGEWGVAGPFPASVGTGGSLFLYISSNSDSLVQIGAVELVSAAKPASASPGKDEEDTVSGATYVLPSYALLGAIAASTLLVWGA
jgi:hypothetical protein